MTEPQGQQGQQDETLVGRAARAMVGDTWDDLSEAARESFRDDARAVIREVADEIARRTFHNHISDWLRNQTATPTGSER